MAKAATTRVFTGNVHVWEAFDRKRHFSEVTLPYSEAIKYIMPVRFNALSGKGEQRELTIAHVKKLANEVMSGAFTPTPIAAGLSPKHIKKLAVEDGKFSLPIDDNDPLPQTDGGHRFAMVQHLIELLEKQIKTETGDKLIELNRHLLQLNNLPFTCTIYFDGNPKKDFINLQAGRSVDSAHMLSMKIQLSDDPALKFAFHLAKLLHSAEDSPFKGMIRFDSRGKLPLPISTLCSKGASDIATSLVGIARIALSKGEVDEVQVSNIVIATFKAIQKLAPEALEYNKVLTPMDKQGTKGSSTMLIGVSSCVLYRHLFGKKKLDEDLTRLGPTIKQTLDQPTNGGMSGQVKRSLMKEFAKLYLGDMELLHDGIPSGLLKTLSCSTFQVTSLPKTPKSTPAKPDEKPETPVAPEPEKPADTKGKKGGKKADEKPTTPPTTVVKSSEPEAPAQNSKAGRPAKPTSSGKTPAKPPATVEASPAAAPWEEEIAG